MTKPTMNDFIRASAGRGVVTPETPTSAKPESPTQIKSEIPSDNPKPPGPDADIATVRRVIAARLNVPEMLADRLKGDTPEAIEADATQLLAELLKASDKPPGNAGNGRGQTGRGKPDMNRWIRAVAGRGGFQ